MKVSMQLDVEVKMISAGGKEVIGTSFQGYLQNGCTECPEVTFKEILKVFGPPALEKEDKVQAQWAGKINGQVFTIYDYKSSIIPEKNTCWHIGGKSKMVADLVNAYFNAS